MVRLSLEGPFYHLLLLFCQYGNTTINSHKRKKHDRHPELYSIKMFIVASQSLLCFLQVGSMIHDSNTVSNNCFKNDESSYLPCQ